jgi:hypothetical protein
LNVIAAYQYPYYDYHYPSHDYQYPYHDYQYPYHDYQYPYHDYQYPSIRERLRVARDGRLPNESLAVRVEVEDDFAREHHRKHHNESARLNFGHHDDLINTFSLHPAYL